MEAKSLGDVLITSQLELRPTRPPDYESQARAIAILSDALADDSKALLQTVANVVAEFCRAGSAGISVLERSVYGREVLRWKAISGHFARNADETFPRNATPCGVVVARNEATLFDRPERAFVDLQDFQPTICEALIVPWQSDGTVIGTLWVFSHTPDRQFDLEDVRLLSTFARFASAAWRLSSAMEATEKSQQERLVLRHLLIVAEEEERKRLSRELHDEAGQRLAGLILGLQLLADEASAGADVNSRIKVLQSEAVGLSRELHSVAVRLRPAALDDFGLEAAIVTYAIEWSTRSGIGLARHLNLHGRVLPPDTSAAIYRVVQEALTNISRHSGGTQASIFLSDNQHEVLLVVEDNGQGMAEASAADSLGIRGMTERVALVGGTIDFETASTGTSIYVRIPLP